MHRLKLDVALREGRGKGAARRLRATGQVPAILYGGGMDPVSLQIGQLELERVIHGGGANALIDLKGPDVVKGKLVLVKEMHRDPVKRSPVHCDLLAVDTRKKLQVEIPVHLTGKARGVEMGGVLEPVMREIEVECLPLAIPDSFEIDVSGLDIGDAVHVRDLQAPPGVEIISPMDDTVVHVVVPRVEVEETPEGEALAEGAVAVEGAGDAAAEGGGED